ncbi:MAG: GGDEF domain-containing protein [Trueperaceae bacterium]
MEPFRAGVGAIKRRIYTGVLPMAAMSALIVGFAGSQEPDRATRIWLVPIVLGVVVLIAWLALLRPRSQVLRIERILLYFVGALYLIALASAPTSAWALGGGEVVALIRVGLWTPVLVAFAFLACRTTTGLVLSWIAWGAFAGVVAALLVFTDRVDAWAATTLLEAMFVQGMAIVMIQGLVHVAWIAIDRADAYAVLAASDPLTGLPNRRSAEDRLDAEIGRADRYGRPLSVIWFDLDRFKSLNHRFGHEAGDRVLSAVGETVRSELREHDLIARWGGEEFVVVLPEQALGEAARTAERLRERLPATSMDLPDDERVTASFGVAERLPRETMRDVLRRADVAMYAAKGAGRDRVQVDADVPDPLATEATGEVGTFADDEERPDAPPA